MRSVRTVPVGETVVDAILTLVRSGRPDHSEIEMVREIRAAIGEQELRLDANGGWTLPTAKQAIRALVPNRPSHHAGHEIPRGQTRYRHPLLIAGHTTDHEPGSDQNAISRHKEMMQSVLRSFLCFNQLMNVGII